MFRFVTGLFVVTFFCHQVSGQSKLPTAIDKSISRSVPTPVDSIPVEKLKTLVSRNANAEWDPNRVITPHMPLAVRQDHHRKPRYQEATSYTFLIHSAKFASMCRMEDGRIAMVITGWIDGADKETRGCLITFSDDEGNTWSQPQLFHQGLERPQPIHLGNNELLIIPMDDDGFITRSSDDGVSWSEKRPFPRLANGDITYHKGSVLVEADSVSAIFMATVPPHGKTGWRAQSLIRTSHDRGETWNDGIWLPSQWETSEGSITRANDGALVVSLRTSQPPEYPEFSDHWRRLTTARSTDNGKSWTDHQVHFKYGKVHSDLVTLKDGRILMTYAARMGELEGKIYHGIEAVISNDHGKTWEWENKFTLFRWAMHQTMHSPCSIELKDGRILTVFLYHYGAQWGNTTTGGNSRTLGITSAVIWSPKIKR
tara:strand:+ start:220 stop:1500 length:1281 start_codon:yes stop_codon:yes gene_type:complete